MGVLGATLPPFIAFSGITYPWSVGNISREPSRIPHGEATQSMHPGLQTVTFVVVATLFGRPMAFPAAANLFFAIAATASPARFGSRSPVSILSASLAYSGKMTYQVEAWSFLMPGVLCWH